MYLKDMFMGGALPAAVLVQWYEECFNGIVPDWAMNALRMDTVVWQQYCCEKLSKASVKVPGLRDLVPTYGAVWYDCDRWSALPAKEGCADGLSFPTNAVSGDACANRVMRVLLRWQRGMSVDMAKLRGDLQFCFPASSSDLANREVIQFGHILRMIERLRSEDRYDVISYMHKLVRVCPGIGGQCFKNFVFAFIINPAARCVLRNVVIRGYLSHGLLFASTMLKACHDIARRADTGAIHGIGDFDTEAESVMYLHVLIGRYSIPGVSSTDEIEARATDGRPQFGLMFGDRNFTDGAVMSALHEVIAEESKHYVEGISARRGKTIGELFHLATMMGTTGSASYARTVGVVDSDGSLSHFVMPNKTISLLYTSKKDFIKMFKHRAELVGVGINKYEAGKLRLLLPGPEYHWFIESVALWGGEHSVYKKDIEISLEESGTHALAELALRLSDTASGNGLTCLNSDFKDMNILHSFRNMVEMWNCLADELHAPVVRMEDINEDTDFGSVAAACCRWAAACLGSVKASAGQGEKLVQLIRGLWSGWRSTTFINTIFNKVYLKVAEDVFRCQYGYKPILRKRVIGDDMAGVARCEFDALEFLSILDYCGFDAQGEKQLISDTRSEYLRLMYRGGSEIKGSLWRAVAGMSSSDMQTPVAAGGPARCTALNENLHLLVRRGADVSVIERIRYQFLQDWSEVNVYSENGVLRKIKCPQWLLRLSTYDGGMGCSRFGEVPPRAAVSIRRVIKPLQNVVPRLRRFFEQNKVPEMSRIAAQAFVERMHSVGIKTSSSVALREMHCAAYISGCLPPKFNASLKHMMSIAIAEYYSQDVVFEEYIDRASEECDSWVHRELSNIMVKLRSGHYTNEDVEDLNACAATVATACMGEMAAVGNMRDVFDLGNTWQQFISGVNKLVGDRVSGQMSSLISAVGPSVAMRMFVGEVTLSVETCGLLAAGAAPLIQNLLAKRLRMFSVKLCGFEFSLGMLRDELRKLSVSLVRMLKMVTFEPILKMNRY